MFRRTAGPKSAGKCERCPAGCNERTPIRGRYFPDRHLRLAHFGLEERLLIWRPAHDLTTDLASFPEFHVLARKTTAGLGSMSGDPRELGRVLHADYLMRDPFSLMQMLFASRLDWSMRPMERIAESVPERGGWEGTGGL